MNHALCFIVSVSSLGYCMPGVQLHSADSFFLSVYIIIFTAAASSYVTIEIKAMYMQLHYFIYWHHFSSMINYTLLTLKFDLNSEFLLSNVATGNWPLVCGCMACYNQDY